MFLMKAAGQVPHFTPFEEHKPNICLRNAPAQMAIVGEGFL